MAVFYRMSFNLHLALYMRTKSVWIAGLIVRAKTITHVEENAEENLSDIGLNDKFLSKTQKSRYHNILKMEEKRIFAFLLYGEVLSFPNLLRYNWQGKFYVFKVYNIMIYLSIHCEMIIKSS
jgi:hypothetical protein